MATYHVDSPHGSYDIESPKELSDDEIHAYIAKASGVDAGPAAPQAPADWKSAFFPRTASGADQDAGYGRQVLNAGSDLLSLPGRYASALNRAQQGQTNKNFKSDLAETKGSGMLGQALRSPATGAAILTAPLAAPLMALAGIPELGAAGIGAGAKIAQGAAMGLQQGVAGGLANQAESVGAGNGFSGKQLGTDVALGMATGAAIPAGGAALKGTGQKILGSILRPSTALEKSGFGPQEMASLGKRGAQAVFDLKLDAPSLEGIAQKTDAKLAELGQAHEQAIAQGEAAGNKVDPYAMLDQTMQKIRANPKIFKGPISSVASTQAFLKNELDVLHEMGRINPGEMNLQQVQDWKSRLGDMANWKGDEYGPALKTFAKLANQDLDRAIDQAAPGIGEINDQLHQAMSVKEALMARLPVHMRNNPVTLGHMGAFVAGGAPGEAAYLATKSPLAAQAAYRFGDFLKPNLPATIGANAAAQSLRGLMRGQDQ